MSSTNKDKNLETYDSRDADNHMYVFLPKPIPVLSFDNGFAWKGRKHSNYLLGDIQRHLAFLSISHLLYMGSVFPGFNFLY